jgi:putative ABC transport system substrate-binding protein
MIGRRAFILSSAALIVAPGVVRAQQQNRIPRIAYLSTGRPGHTVELAFRAGLREFGYTEGVTVIVETFLAPTNAALPEWASKAVASKPDLIVTASTLPTVAAKAQTTTIPIVFARVGSPVELGIVASIARPGGNLTGTTGVSAEVQGKLLDLLKQMVPGLARVTVIYSADQLDAPRSLAEVVRAAGILKIDVRTLAVAVAAELAPAIASAAAGGAEAIFFVAAPIFGQNEQLIADEVRKHRLPSIEGSRGHPDAGGLMAYGANVQGSYRRAAYYVDRILKGAKPADLPVEQPMVFDFVINKRTADALGLTIPPKLMIFATEIIE